MNNNRLPKCILLIFSLFSMLYTSSGRAQTVIPSSPWQVDSTLIVDRPDFVFHFPANHFPQMATLEIRKNKLPLREGLDYQIKKKEALNFYGLLQIGDTLRIRYHRLPLHLNKSFTLYRRDSLQSADISDSMSGQATAQKVWKIKFENPFTDIRTNLQTSGSIMRGVNIGTNRDLTLNSGLNVELSGKLTDNVEIVAALTDEATPIQPEGNTQTLQEVDKVFVQFKTPFVNGTVGDFNLMYRNTQFSNLNRKLQGLTLLGNYKNHSVGVTIASTRGFFNHVSFIGQEGNQGPYQLTGKNGEREIIVLAGTERVWVDGKQMVRGQDNDYVIEYGNGQITFTTQRLITSASRIEIDFEYFPAIQKYNRNVYSGLAATSILNDQLKLNVRYFREADDPDQILQEGGGITEEEKEIIRNAGDDPFKAYVPGEIFKPDTSGNYSKIDTVIDGNPYSYFEYVGSGNGLYVVRFSYVGPKGGDYVRDRLGVYRWVGNKKGDYAPVRLLPLPVDHQTADVQLEWTPTQRIKMQAEYAQSRQDRNRLSSLDDGDNTGNAFILIGDLEEQPLKFGALNLGQINFTLNAKYVDKQFRSVDRIVQPDYQRYWNLLPDVQGSTEELSIQANGVYKPLPGLKLAGNLGHLQKSDFKSQRMLGLLQYTTQNEFNTLWRYEYIGSSQLQQGSNNNWQRYHVEIEKAIWKLKPALFFDSEWRKEYKPEYLSGFKFYDYGVSLGLIRWKYFAGQLGLQQRDDYIYDIEQYKRLVFQARSLTGRMFFNLQNVRETTASLEIVHRQKNYADKFKNVKVDTIKLKYVDPTLQDTVWQDRTTNLADLRVSHSRWKKAVYLSLQYRVSTKQTALKEKVYLDVGQGRGNLRYDKDLDEYVPDPDGKYVLFILPSGKYEPVTNLQTALRLRFDPSRYWRRGGSRMQKFLALLSSETYLRVEEETKEGNIWSVYFLNLSKFQGDQTLRGTIQFSEDLYIMRRNRNLSFRLRYRYNKNRINQYLDIGENEDRADNEWGIRTDWRLSTRIKNQTELRKKFTMRDSPANPNRNRRIDGWYVTHQFSFRPVSRIEVGLEGEYGHENNRAERYPLKLWYGAAKGRLSFSLPGKGRLSGEYNLQKVQITDNPLSLTVPFEMANGKKEGLTQIWQLRAEYNVVKNIQFTLFYTGRNEAGFERVIHSGQAEVRAFF